MSVQRIRRATRRSRLIAMALAFGLVLAACGSDDPPAAESPAPDPEPAEEAEADDEPEPTGPQMEDGRLLPLPSGFPDQPVTLWAGFPPGHVNDIFNRTVAEIASDYSPVRFTTDTQQGVEASNYGLVRDFMHTLPGWEDGYHLHAANWAAQAVNPYQNPAQAVFEIDYLRPLGSLYTVPYAYAVPADSEFETLDDVLDYARENPGQMNYVSGQAGSRGHLEMILFLREPGNEDVDVVFVPTDGVGDSVRVLLGGGAQFIGTGLHTLEDLDQYRFLAVTGGERLDLLPDVPTMLELGYTGAQHAIDGYAQIGYGIADEVPDEHAEWLEAIMRLVVDDPRFEEQYPWANTTFRDAATVRQDQNALIDVLYPVLEELELTVRER